MPRPVVSDHNRQDWASPNFIEGNQDRDLRCLHRYSTQDDNLLLYIYNTRSLYSTATIKYRSAPTISHSREEREAEESKKNEKQDTDYNPKSHHVTAAHITYAPNLHHQLGLDLGHITVCLFHFPAQRHAPSRSRAVGHLLRLLLNRGFAS